MSKGIKLATPAYAVAIGYLIVLIVILLPFNISDVIDPEVAASMSPQYNLAERLFIILLMLVPFALSVYSVNCFVVGKCVVWSWIHAVIILLWVIMFVAGVVLFSRKQKTEYFSLGDVVNKARAIYKPTKLPQPTKTAVKNDNVAKSDNPYNAPPRQVAYSWQP
jgi:hypothetical protein